MPAYLLLRLVRRLQHLGDGLQLNDVRALVDRANLGIAIKFLHGILFGEANAAVPLDAAAGHALGDLRARYAYILKNCNFVRYSQAGTRSLDNYSDHVIKWNSHGIMHDLPWRSSTWPWPPPFESTDRRPLRAPRSSSADIRPRSRTRPRRIEPAPVWFIHTHEINSSEKQVTRARKTW
jgi:hypothetical protein